MRRNRYTTPDDRALYGKNAKAIQQDRREEDREARTMARTQKPKITTKCPTNAHTAPRETIAEFSVIADDGNLYGGLLSLLNTGDGLRVSLYRLDEGVTVDVAGMTPCLVAIVDRTVCVRKFAAPKRCPSKPASSQPAPPQPSRRRSRTAGRFPS